jgi:signal transduction histidine kinase
VDNGTGIAKEIRTKIYDMFYRGSQASTGTGLGLYIVKNAVDKLGGTIQLNSSEEHGAWFVVTLSGLLSHS